MRSRGGRLSADDVDLARLGGRLRAPIAGPIEWHREVGSTNDLLAQRAREGAPEGAIVCADHQTAGRGRLGREWQDVPGRALAMSVLLRPPPHVAAHAGVLPVLVATAVAQGIGDDAQVAWPNDVVLGGRKVSGILLEAAWEASALTWVVVGMGVNVRGAPDVPPGTWPVGVLDERDPDPSREAVAGRILEALAGRYSDLCEAGPRSIVTAFTARDALAGRVVRLREADEVTEGSAEGITEDGGLRLRTPGGVVVVASADRLELLAPTG